MFLCERTGATYQKGSPCEHDRDALGTDKHLRERERGLPDTSRLAFLCIFFLFPRQKREQQRFYEDNRAIFTKGVRLGVQVKAPPLSQGSRVDLDSDTPCFCRTCLASYTRTRTTDSSDLTLTIWQDETTVVGLDGLGQGKGNKSGTQELQAQMTEEDYDNRQTGPRGGACLHAMYTSGSLVTAASRARGVLWVWERGKGSKQEE